MPSREVGYLRGLATRLVGLGPYRENAILEVGFLGSLATAPVGLGPYRENAILEVGFPRR